MEKNIWLVGFEPNIYRESNSYGQWILDIINIWETNLKLLWILEKEWLSAQISSLSSMEWIEKTNIVLDSNSTHSWAMIMLNKFHLWKQDQLNDEWISFWEFVNHKDRLIALRKEVLEIIEQDKVICLFPNAPKYSFDNEQARFDTFSDFTIVKTAEEAMEIISSSK